MSKKKHNQTKEQKRAQRKKTRQAKDHVDEEILSSISDPNPWTPEREDAWLKQPADALRKRFPPMGKPPYVARRSPGSGWGDT